MSSHDRIFYFFCQFKSNKGLFIYSFYSSRGLNEASVYCLSLSFSFFVKQSLHKDWRLNNSDVGCKEATRTLKEKKICQYVFFLPLNVFEWNLMLFLQTPMLVKVLYFMLLEPWGKILLLAPPPPLQGGERSWSATKNTPVFQPIGRSLVCLSTYQTKLGLQAGNEAQKHSLGGKPVLITINSFWRTGRINKNILHFKKWLLISHTSVRTRHDNAKQGVTNSWKCCYSCVQMYWQLFHNYSMSK